MDFFGAVFLVLSRVEVIKFCEKCVVDQEKRIKLKFFSAQIGLRFSVFSEETFDSVIVSIRAANL